MKLKNLKRRDMLLGSLACSAAIGLRGIVKAADKKADADERPQQILKTLKLNMVRTGNTLSEKFSLAKEAGFDGIELDSPQYSNEEILEAIQQGGLQVDGTVCQSHWNVRHSDPDAAVREQALKDLIKALKQTKTVGGHTCLLVVGHGKDGSIQEVRERSIANIRRAVPVAAELGVMIAIENVWNHFLYDHEAGPDQDVQPFIDYVDEFDSPWVGMQFDIGNHWKYANPGAWIRKLGKRIVKLDIKGFSRAKNQFTAITKGDLPWSDVREALRDINFAGWCAAEVDGGDLDALKLVANQMNEALQLA